MRTFALIIVTIFLLMFHSPARAFHKWYDEKGIVHYTQADPPSIAKNEDGSSWWAEEPDQDAGKVALQKKREDTQKKIEQARVKLKNDSAPEPELAKITPPIGEDVSEESEEEEYAADQSEGFSIPSLSFFKLWGSTRIDTGEATGSLCGVWGSSTDDIFVVGTGEGIPLGNNRFRVTGGIFHYDGDEWSEMSSSDDEFMDGIMLHAVWGSSGKDVYAVGSNWAILYYDGIEWSRIETGLYSNTGPAGGFWSVWGSSATDIYAVGNSTERGGVALHFDGDYWRQIALPETTETYRDRYHCVWGTSAENVFILGEMGRVYQYDGSTWETMDIDGAINLRGIWGSSSEDVFAAGYDGKIFHYDGDEWSKMFELKDMHFQGIWGNSAKNVYAAGSRVNDGAIFFYNGTKWNQIKTANGVRLNGIWCHKDGDVFAVGNGNLVLHYSGISIFTLALGGLAFGLGIYGRKFIRK